jgi:hypothetical protein
LGFGTGNAIDDDCFYFISWLSKGLIIYQWRMQGMRFGGAGCDIYIYIYIYIYISINCFLNFCSSSAQRQPARLFIIIII